MFNFQRLSRTFKDAVPETALLKLGIITFLHQRRWFHSLSMPLLSLLLYLVRHSLTKQNDIILFHHFFAAVKRFKWSLFEMPPWPPVCAFLKWWKGCSQLPGFPIITEIQSLFQITNRTNRTNQTARIGIILTVKTNPNSKLNKNNLAFQIPLANIKSHEDRGYQKFGTQ